MQKFEIYRRKLILTLLNFKKTAYHHYGQNVSSLFKLIYYSGIRINTFLVFEKDLTGMPSACTIESDYRIISPRPEQLAKVREAMDLPREFYCDEVYGLKTCYLAFKGDDLAYLQWLIFKGDYSRFLTLPEGVVEFNYIVTMPNFRGKSLCAKVMSYISNRLKEDGYKKVVGVIHEENIPSIKAFEKAGFRKVAQINSFGPFNWRFKVVL